MAGRCIYSQLDSLGVRIIARYRKQLFQCFVVNVGLQWCHLRIATWFLLQLSCWIFSYAWPNPYQCMLMRSKDRGDIAMRHVTLPGFRQTVDGRSPAPWEEPPIDDMGQTHQTYQLGDFFKLGSSTKKGLNITILGGSSHESWLGVSSP